MKECYDRLVCKALMLNNRVKNFLSSERGDTNFISILIILVIVLGLAIVFLGFKDTIVGWVETKMGDLEGQILN